MCSMNALRALEIAGDEVVRACTELGRSEGSGGGIIDAERCVPRRTLRGSSRLKSISTKSTLGPKPEPEVALRASSAETTFHSRPFDEYDASVGWALARKEEE